MLVREIQLFTARTIRNMNRPTLWAICRVTE
jgi:hypothetical protein